MIKPDIVATAERENLELKQKGKDLWSLCPLPGHSEKTPSFKISPARQHFHCFGCGADGDVITLIQKLKGLSFKQAISYLGINGKPYKPDPKEIKKRQLLQHFRQWCNDYHSDLCSLIRCFWKAKQQAKDEADLEKLVEFYHNESIWLAQIEILQMGDDEDKLGLYREVVYGN